MYAIETKKRKFDRILESIKDHSATQSGSNVLPRNNNVSTVSLLAADGSGSSTKKARLSAVTGSSKNNSTTSLTSQKTANYLPTSREAFLDRLETFRPVTKWHIASNEPINAAAWAKRGWRCVGTDTVSCPSCGERLLVKIDEEDDSTTSPAAQDVGGPTSQGDVEEDDSYMMAAEIHSGLVAKYQDMITTAHSDGCPWRRRGCVDSIQRIEGLLNAPTALLMLQDRYDGMTMTSPAPEIPCVQVESEDELCAAIIPLLDPKPLESAYLLAICGWQKAAQGGSDVVECRHCFRHLGLWLYRGDEPTMEKLDAVNSHLEYCPWRSSETQATEIDLQGTKHMVPGWYLVAQTVERQKPKKFPAPSADSDVRPMPQALPPEIDETSNPDIEEKQRDKKMKDLLRRVKELKKPFNVKALLKKNKKLV